MHITWHRLRSALAVSLAAFAAFQACTDPKDTAPNVPARPGAFQPDGGGTLISEAEACDRVTAAEDQARTDLGCAAAERAACPAYVRPSGAEACFAYDDATVAGCEEFFDNLPSCQELDTRRCIVSAVFDATLPGCERGEGGAGGEAGASSGGSGGVAGAAGGAGAAGDPGAGGAGAPSAGGQGGA